MTEPTQKAIEAEMERVRPDVHYLLTRAGGCFLAHGRHSAHCDAATTCAATALARRALESLVEAEAVAALHIAPVLIDNGCDCDFEGPHEGLPCEELGHEPCDMCRIERGLNAIRALRDGKR